LRRGSEAFPFCFQRGGATLAYRHRRKLGSYAAHKIAPLGDPAYLARPSGGLC
jgi:hypothetical protein